MYYAVTAVVAPFGSSNVIRPKGEEKNHVEENVTDFNCQFGAAACFGGEAARKKQKKAIRAEEQFRWTWCSTTMPPFTNFVRTVTAVGACLAWMLRGVEAVIDKFRFKLNVGLNGSRYFRLDFSDCVSSPVCESSTLYSDGWNVFATGPDCSNRPLSITVRID